MVEDTVQRLADTLVLGSLLEDVQRRFGGYELLDHWKQGEFHHDVVVRVPEPGRDLPGHFLIIATNCNGGVKEVLCFDDLPDRWALWHWRCPQIGEFSGSLPPMLVRAMTPHWFDPCDLLAPDARSELKANHRQRQQGGGWEMAPSACNGSLATVDTAVVTIVAEWFPDPETGLRRVLSERGIFPECRVGRVPVLVMWGPLAVEEHPRLLSTFRESAGSEALLVVVGPEAGDGWVRVDARCGGAERQAAFIAAAAVKAGWGWDESERIRVEDAEGSLLIALHFDAKVRGFQAKVIHRIES